MISFLFRLFSKDYNVPYVKDSFVQREIIFPYNNLKYGSFVKGNIYVRKIKTIYGYKNILFKDYSKIQYTGILHVTIEDQVGNQETKTIELKPNYFNSDSEFIQSIYKEYNF